MIREMVGLDVNITTVTLTFKPWPLFPYNIPMSFPDFHLSSENLRQPSERQCTMTLKNMGFEGNRWSEFISWFYYLLAG